MTFFRSWLATNLASSSLFAAASLATKGDMVFGLGLSFEPEGPGGGLGGPKGGLGGDPVGGSFEAIVEISCD